MGGFGRILLHQGLVLIPVEMRVLPHTACGGACRGGKEAGAKEREPCATEHGYGELDHLQFADPPPTALVVQGAASATLLWRAVDQDGITLDILVQSRRNGTAAKRFFKRLLKDLRYVSRVFIPDKLGSYGVAKRELLPDVEHR
jgi:hypothetical protein